MDRKYDTIFKEACRCDPILTKESELLGGDGDEIAIKLKDGRIIAFNGYYENFYAPTDFGDKRKNIHKDRNIVSKNLCNAMNDVGLSRQDMCFMTKIDPYKMTGYMEGRNRVSYTDLLKICEVLNCHPSDLTTESSSTNYEYTMIDDDVFRQKFSIKLKSLMNNLNIDRTTLSNKTGIHNSSIGGYINGKTIPNRKNLIKLSKALGYPVNDLLDFD